MRTGGGRACCIDALDTHLECVLNRRCHRMERPKHWSCLMRLLEAPNDHMPRRATVPDSGHGGS